MGVDGQLNPGKRCQCPKWSSIPAKRTELFLSVDLILWERVSYVWNWSSIKARWQLNTFALQHPSLCWIHFRLFPHSTRNVSSQIILGVPVANLKIELTRIFGILIRIMSTRPSVLFLLLVVMSSAVTGRVWNSAGFVRWSPNCNFVGYDIGRVHVPAIECGKECINNPGCTHFTNTLYTCYLKRNVNGWTERRSSNTDCGFVLGRSLQSTNIVREMIGKRVAV